MPIRWSALKVKEATDKVEEIVNPLIEPLKQAKNVVIEARKIPNLPDYMNQRLCRLETEIERVTGGVGREWVKREWQERPFKGYIQRVIEDIRKDLPKQDLAREEHKFKLYLDLYGDKEKAELAMATYEPVKASVPKEQTRMNLGDITDGELPIESELEGCDNEDNEEDDELLSEV